MHRHDRTLIRPGSGSGHVSEGYRIADTLGLRVAGPSALVAPFARQFGLMAAPRLPPALLHLSVSPLQELAHAHVFEQTYAGGRWRLGVESLEGPVIHARAAVDRLGRVMVAQAGAGPLLRWMLGRHGFVWLHAAVLARDDRILVLAGPSGSGKSQLVLRAIRDGWRYLTDDHALLCERGVTGLTTPILLRGYGGWPSGMRQPLALRLRRLAATLARLLTLRRTNLMVAWHPEEEATERSPPPRRRPTAVVWLERGPATTLRTVPPDEIAGRLFDGMRHAGRFLDQLAAGYRGRACPIDAAAFWTGQRLLLGRGLVGTTCAVATLEPPVDDDAAGSLFALLDHLPHDEGAGGPPAGLRRPA